MTIPHQLPGMRPVLVLDYGVFPMPKETLAVLRETKLRLDGQPDKRTRIGRQWPAYIRRQNEKAAEFYIDGRDDFVPEPWLEPNK
jgi:hypothetical protein